MYLTRYADARSKMLAPFEEDVDVSSGSVPGVRLHGDSLSTWRESDMPSRSRAATFRSNAATLGWNNTPAGSDTTTPRWPARFTVSLSDSLSRALSLTARDALLLTVGTTDQKPGPRRVPRDTSKRDSTKRDTSAKATPAKRPTPSKSDSKPAKDTVPPDFTLEVEDAEGRVARLPLTTFGAVRLPIESYIYRRRGRDKSQFPTLAEPIMQTYVAPLAAFREANTALDVTRLRALRLVFDRKRVGSIQLGDSGVSRPE